MRKISYFAASLFALAIGMDGACGANEPRNEQTDPIAAQDGGDALSDSAIFPTSDRAGTVPDASIHDLPGSSTAYVGGWDWSGQPYPLRSFALDHAQGQLTPRAGSSDLGANPSHLTTSRDGKLLYAANEYEGPLAGLSVARIDRASGALDPLQSVPYADGAFVYVRIHPSGQYLFAADYYAGKLVVYRLTGDGKIGAVAASESFARKSADESAQTHSVAIDESGKFVYVPNKALDAVARLHFDVKSGALTRKDDVPSPGGPRHVALFGKLAFVMHELDNHLASFRIGDDGALTPIAEASTLPADFTGKSLGAQVSVHPSGKFVYASNRGHDSIAVFATTAEGALTRLSLTPTEGKTPRSFDLDARGTLLVVANQGSDDADDGSLLTFGIGPDGLLTRRGQAVTGLKAPTTVVLVPRDPAH